MKRRKQNLLKLLEEKIEGTDNKTALEKYSRYTPN
jgi:hypothetical protein